VLHGCSSLEIVLLLVLVYEFRIAIYELRVRIYFQVREEEKGENRRGVVTLGLQKCAPLKAGVNPKYRRD
jgi:hypothetical protein